MSSLSNDRGRYFEYACVMALKKRISTRRSVIVDDESTVAARRAWETLNENERLSGLRAAEAFVDVLFSAEPLILEQEGATDAVVLSINKDSDAEKWETFATLLLRESQIDGTSDCR